MSIDIEGTFNALITLGRKAGGFEVVRIGEFKSPPPKATTLAMWVNDLGADDSGGGLAVTGASMAMTARIYHPAMTNPESVAEIKVTVGAAAYLGQLNGSLTLGGLCQTVDMLGIDGSEARWKYGYLTIDSTMYRVADLSFTIIFNDAWTQAQ